ncbi:transposase [Piscirickettsia salmonis]|uniref:transposase n=1 Tax=Piscirickettsia salmonis TaxID=1238 RepID=UPI00094A532F|nr:transposase [Piscirickettsia salmonis]APS58211.1 transposase [Piscirickettsia salmonis]QNR79964.1 transposase [Piscirickettsia salmonis]WGZ70406.1 hypothetical protein E3220_01120 [Piscirickettsia salmonis EM-90]
MNKELLDIYSDYLISQNHYATATGLSDLLEGSISHDKVTRFLNKNHFGSKELWSYVKKHVRQYEEEVGGVLSLDDTVEEKPYTDENDVVCWHYSHSKSAHVKGINILTSMVTYKKTSVPIGYETVLKDIKFRKRRYLGRYFAHPMMQNRRAKRDDYKPSAVRVTQRCVP